MNKADTRVASRTFAQPPGLLDDGAHEVGARTSRGLRPALLDQSVAKRACEPFGALQSVVVTTGPRNRRRTWYVVDPDPSRSSQYAAKGLDLFPGCKVLIDAASLQPVALLGVDPVGPIAPRPAPAPAPHGFNPYFDLPEA